MKQTQSAEHPFFHLHSIPSVPTHSQSSSSNTQHKCAAGTQENRTALCAPVWLTLRLCLPLTSCIVCHHAAQAAQWRGTGDWAEDCGTREDVQAHKGEVKFWVWICFHTAGTETYHLKIHHCMYWMTPKTQEYPQLLLALVPAGMGGQLMCKCVPPNRVPQRP